jgi:hypothetical protein
MPEKKHWREILGNPLIYNLHPAMLTPHGYDLLTSARHIGMGKSERKKELIIHFDEEYVIEKLKSDVLFKLQPKDYNDFQKCVSKAWKLFAEKQKQEV